MLTVLVVLPIPHLCDQSWLATGTVSPKKGGARKEGAGAKRERPLAGAAPDGAPRPAKRPDVRGDAAKDSGAGTSAGQAIVLD